MWEGAEVSVLPDTPQVNLQLTVLVLQDSSSLLCRSAVVGRSIPEQQELKEHIPRQSVTMETPLLDARHSIYDNDEFDVFHRSYVDPSKVRRGKQ